MFTALAVILVTALVIIGQRIKKNKKNFTDPSEAKLSDDQRRMLAEHVDYYGGLDLEEKERFESEVAAFLTTVKITGVGVEVEDLDLLLIGASATIPLFGFPEWHYPNLTSIILYRDRFNPRFEHDQPDSTILGMVGTGHWSGSMFLSKPDLRQGFSNGKDRRNVGIHEFAHLVDGYDGSIEGIPAIYLDQPAILPWMDLIQTKSREIVDKDSDINPYALTNSQEFLAVTAEYFFEDPKRLKTTHPALYGILNKMFNQDTADMAMGKVSPPRPNDKCYCGSGKKFKYCHGSQAD